MEVPRTGGARPAPRIPSIGRVAVLLALIATGVGFIVPPTAAGPLDPRAAAADPRIDFWEGDDGTQDRVCILPFQEGVETDFQEDDFSCENDEARSAVLFDLSPGMTVTVFDSPDCATDDDWTRIEVVRPIGPEGHLIGWFEGSFSDGTVEVTHSGGNDLAGKVSCVRTDTPDWDEDAIPDAVERFGIRNANGDIVMDLDGMGVSPCRKTILVEIDWMTGASDGHDHRPSEEAMREATFALANAPVPGPTSCPYPGEETGNGIQLRYDASGTIPEQEVYELPADVDALMNNPAYFDPARAPFVRYNPWIHMYGEGGVGNGSSGLAPAGTDPRSFTVSLGGFENPEGTSREQSGTFLHELGHTIGLGHGGGDGVNFKPNYLSVMNYRFQTTGLTVAPDLDPSFSFPDYSHEALGRLDSHQLVEADGIGDGQVMTAWLDSTGALQSNRGDRQLDWNGNKVIDPVRVSVPLTGDLCVGPGPNGTLDTPNVASDVVVGNTIRNGTDFTCNTAVNSALTDDVQAEQVGLDERYLDGYDDWEHVNLRAGAPVHAGQPELTAKDAKAIQEGWDDALNPDRTVRLGEPGAGFSTATMGTAVDDRFVYATHYRQPDGDPAPPSPDPGQLVVLDRTTLQIVARVPVGHSPRSVAVNPVTGKIYVVNYGVQSYSVTVVNRGTWDVAATIPVGQAPIDVAVNTNLNRAYVSVPFQQEIEVIDGATNTLLPPIPIGRGPLGLAVDHTTNTLWVARTHRSSEPHVVGLSSVTDRGTGYDIHPLIDLSREGNQPNDVAVDPANDRVYVANLGGGGVHPNLAAIDRTDRTLIKTVPLTGPARSIAVNGYSDQVFVAGEGRVDVIVGSTLERVRRIPVAFPTGFPWAIAVEQGSGRRLYVGDVRNGRLSRFSFTSGEAVP
jgi:YVTN family beta-propeller protein